MYAKEQANEILRQLGGSRFIAFTGAKSFVYSVPADARCELRFRLPARFAKDGINLVCIKLTVMDVYEVSFFKFSTKTNTLVALYDDVYCDQLQEIFTAATGLDTHF